MTQDCLFCKIVKQEIPAKICYEDEDLLVFDDIRPQAPIHKIIIPKQHIATLNDLDFSHHPLLGKMLHRASLLAQELEISEQGYRLVMNCKAHGGQTVYHIHLHLIGGRQMTWPPG